MSAEQESNSEPLFPDIANPRQRAFLTAFRETGNVQLACKVSQVARSSHYRWLDEDPAYRAACDLAREDAADVLEVEAQRRAVQGVEKPTGWYQGKPGGYVREYSDLLLIFLLKGARPEKYKDRVELKGALSTIDYSRLTDEQLSRIVGGEHPMAVLGSVPGVARHAPPADTVLEMTKPRGSEPTTRAD